MNSVALLLVAVTMTSSPIREFDGIRVLAQDVTGVTLEYLPGELSMEATGDPDGGVRLRLPAAAVDDVAGRPALPHRVVALGVPPGVEVRAMIQDWQGHSIPLVDVAPVPLFDQFGGAGWDRALDVYGHRDWVPARKLVVKGPGLSRGRRVVSVRLNPVRWQPKTGSVDVAERMQVRVDFVHQGATRAIRRESQDRFTAVHRNALLNWDTARHWGGVDVDRSDVGSTPLDESDRWIRMDVSEEGIYELTRSDFEDAGIDGSTVDPASVRIFTAAIAPLATSVGDTTPVFAEVAPVTTGDGDAVFETGESVVFFAGGLHGWGPDSTWVLHPYDDERVYWVTWGWDLAGEPLRLAPIPSMPEPEDPVWTTARRRVHVERESVPPRNWGVIWYWHLQSHIGETTYTYDVDLPGAIGSGPTILTVREIGASNASAVRGEHHVSVALNDPSNVAADTSWDGHNPQILTGEPPDGPTDGTNAIRITNFRDQDGDVGGGYRDETYLDWIEVDYGVNLTAFDGDRLDFECDADSAVTLAISGFTAPVSWVFDISDPFAPQMVEFESASGGGRWRTQAGPRRYVAVTDEALLRPVDVRSHAPARLRASSRGADWIVVTVEPMAEAAQALADHRTSSSGLRTDVVDIADVYAEFSAGIPDPAALRNFLAAAYSTWQAPAPAYVLLLGDGTYDMKNNAGQSQHRSILPTYQSPASHHTTAVDTYDDWFVRVDPDDFAQDMMIGRIPVLQSGDADAAVEKIIAYESAGELGRWRQRLTFVADDEMNPDYNWFGEVVHTVDTEALVNLTVPQWLEAERLYLVDFLPNNDGEKPAAGDAIVDAFNEGTLLVSYLGHGNEVQWAHEHVLDSRLDLPLIENGGRLPLVLAGSCTVGRFDLDDTECMAEALTLREDAGAIAMVAATRPTFSNPNFRLMRTLLDGLFDEEDRDAGLDVGSAHLAARLAEGDGRNERLNHLFGDPALRLSVPRYGIEFDVVDPESLLVPLDEVGIAGHVVGPGGGVLSQDGLAEIEVRDGAFDDVYTIPYEGNEGRRMSFLRRGEVIFRGTVPIEAGAFEARFLVPMHCRSGVRGEVTVYAELDDGSDASGVLEGLAFEGGDVNVDGVVALEPIDAARGATVARPWGWSDDVVDRDSVVGAPDSVSAFVPNGAWIGMDFDDRPWVPGDVLSDGASNADGPDLDLSVGAGDSWLLYGSTQGVHWRFIDAGTGPSAVDMTDAFQGGLKLLRLFPGNGTEVPVDDSGPDIQVYAAGRPIGASAPTVGRGTPITFVLEDDQGIALGAGAGIDLVIETLTSDGRLLGSDGHDLTSGFSYDQGSYVRGRVIHLLDEPPGRVRLIVTAHDQTGASHSATVDLVVGAGLAFTDVGNYPNPFHSSTWFVWYATDANAVIRIYTTTGRRIRTLESEGLTDGVGRVEWDGKDDDGDLVANGVYLYRVELTSRETGERESRIGKAVVMR